MKKLTETTRRGANYYISICKELAKASTATTDELYEIITTVDREQGMKSTASSKIVVKLEEILGENLEKIVDEDTKRRGRSGKNYMYSLFKVDVRSEIENHFEQIELKKKRASRGPKKAVKTTTTPTGISPSEKGMLDLVWLVLQGYMGDSKYQTNGISFRDIGKQTGRGFNSKILEGWLMRTEKYGIRLNTQVITVGTEKTVFFKNIKSTIIGFTKTYEQLTGIKLETKIASGPAVKTIVRTENPINLSEVEVANIYFAVGGIINLSGRNISIDDMCVTLHKSFNMFIGKQDLIGLLKREPEFSIIQHGSVIGLKDKDTSWEIISDVYNPKKQKFTVLARIGLAPEQVNEYVQASVVSKITDTDCIYELSLDKSIHSLKSMTRLFRTFRGTDKILEKTIEEDLIREIKIQDGRMYKDYPAYEIEK